MLVSVVGSATATKEIDTVHPTSRDTHTTSHTSLTSSVYDAGSTLDVEW